MKPVKKQWYIRPPNVLNCKMTAKEWEEVFYTYSVYEGETSNVWTLARNCECIILGKNECWQWFVHVVLERSCVRDFHRMSGPYACDKRGLPGHIQYPKDGGYCCQLI